MNDSYLNASVNIGIHSFIEDISSRLAKREERLVHNKNGLRPIPAAVLLNLCHSKNMNISNPLDYIFIILEKRSQLMNSHPGDMALPGGSMEEEDIDLFETAVRETEEEIGLDRNIPKLLGYMDEYISSSKSVVRCIVSHSEFDVPHTELENHLNSNFYPRNEESDSTVAVPLSHFLKAENYNSVLIDTDNQLGVYIRYFNIDIFLENTVIWGLTATMIRRFLDIQFKNDLPEEPTEIIF